MLTIQYLEDSPALLHMDRKLAIDKLQAAAGYLPFTHLLIGWNVPQQLLEACRVEAERLGMRFMRWQPLLTTDKDFLPEPDWQTQAPMGNKLVGYRGMPEFTFACPNHPEVQEAIIKHIGKLIRQGLYQGFFLDRIRFPSPSTHPIKDLACFCDHCRRKAEEFGLDLDLVKRDLLSFTQAENRHLSWVKSLLTGWADPERIDLNPSFTRFLAFRKKCIVDILANVTRILREAHLEVGLDCFSPGLTHMVGQDLRLMSRHVDWIKVMTYAHAFGPAGLPYELSCFVDYLIRFTNLSEEQALHWISQCLGMPLPNNRVSLLQDGLSSLALEQEVKRGIESCSVPLLAGVELVELEGITKLNNHQLMADLNAVKQAKPAGLAISWDLLHIPLDRLGMVNQVYLG
ncbi:MAG: hypothetical protein A2Z71_11945 [Chloroflexi bacterium RBG_13_50_21]|nr:MAG: hypothetical protein A2Z71_11945 [Chloroflexi bacterium RBG_13_50_21]OGO62053.1 MAG: hypothetical protein A2030_07250 [Chloroflexi bacterium RBG_19FT_COMBO_50_10]